MYRVGQKMALFFVRLIILSNTNRFLKFFHYQYQEPICNKTITIDPTTSEVCRYTTLWNIRRRTQAGDATDQFRDERRSSLPCGPKQPGLKSSQLCSLGGSSADGLSILTIHDSQLAETSHSHWVGQTAAAFGSRHWSVASHSWMHRPAASQTH